MSDIAGDDWHSGGDSLCANEQVEGCYWISLGFQLRFQLPPDGRGQKVGLEDAIRNAQDDVVPACEQPLGSDRIGRFGDAEFDFRQNDRGEMQFAFVSREKRNHSLVGPGPGKFAPNIGVNQHRRFRDPYRWFVRAIADRHHSRSRSGGR